MIRNEFQRTTPEAVGIHSKDIDELLTRLEEDHTQMHGIMIMRQNQICVEGWWSPYAPGLRHGLQSLTKTYAATAVGIAYTEGLLTLDTRLIDIFTEEVPTHPSDNLKNLKVKDVLCMGCGMDEMPVPKENWVEQFLSTPVNHQPGTTFMYNSIGSSMLGAIIKKLTGCGLQEYLKPRLFDKIGIDSENLRWFYHPDGTEVGGGGLFATTEDNLRLMKLYMDGGVWEGERILAEDYVKKAISIQNDSSTEQLVNPPATDNFLGYGYQIWMCQPKGVYRADGAMGQFSICFPQEEMIISITETAIGAEGIQRTLDEIWEFSKKVSSAVKKLPDNRIESDKLKNRLQHLSIKNPEYTTYEPKLELYNDIEYQVTEGTLMFESNMVQELVGGAFSDGIKKYRFHFAKDKVEMRFEQDEKEHLLNIAIDGTRCANQLSTLGNVIDKVLVNGVFQASNEFLVTARWPETCFTKHITFTFKENQCSMIIETEPFTTTIPGGTQKMQQPKRAHAVAIQ